MENLLNHCTLCPRRCGVNRNAGARGFCGAGRTVRVARTMLHAWEEPCLVGTHGAGAVFFSHCTLRCVYCQNHTIIARTQGLNLSVVWNTSGYETVENIDRLAGAVDIYLPDLKYASEESGRRCSAASDYAAAAWAALGAMVAQAGAVQFAADGRLIRGVLVRHLVLPGHRHESIALVRRLWETFGDAIQLSLMRQYTPLYRAAEFPPLHRRLTTFEYESVVAAARDLGMERVYVQSAEAVGAQYVPDFT